MAQNDPELMAAAIALLLTFEANFGLRLADCKRRKAAAQARPML
jgi:hypothetical protein